MRETDLGFDSEREKGGVSDKAAIDHSLASGQDEGRSRDVGFEYVDIGAAIHMALIVSI